MPMLLLIALIIGNHKMSYPVYVDKSMCLKCVVRSHYNGNPFIGVGHIIRIVEPKYCPQPNHNKPISKIEV